MWVNPNHPNPSPAAEPPREQGKRLAAFSRGGGQELRLNLATYQNRPYLSLRVWEQDKRTGAWWPVKGKGCSVRLAEAGPLAEVLAEVAAGTDRGRGQQPADDRPKFVDKGRPQRPPWEAEGLPGADRNGQGFSEFEGSG